MSDKIIAAGAIVAALLILGKGAALLVKRIRSVVRTLDVIEAVVQRELHNNHGSSIKDDVTGIAVAVGKLGRDVDELTGQLSDVDTRLGAYGLVLEGHLARARSQTPVSPAASSPPARPVTTKPAKRPADAGNKSCQPTEGEAPDA